MVPTQGVSPGLGADKPAFHGIATDKIPCMANSASSTPGCIHRDGWSHWSFQDTKPQASCLLSVPSKGLPHPGRSKSTSKAPEKASGLPCNSLAIEISESDFWSGCGELGASAMGIGDGEGQCLVLMSITAPKNPEFFWSQPQPCRRRRRGRRQHWEKEGFQFLPASHRDAQSIPSASLPQGPEKAGQGYGNF